MENKVVVTGGLGFIGLNCLHYWIENSVCRNFSIIDDFSVGKPADLTGMLSELGSVEVGEDGARITHKLRLDRDRQAVGDGAEPGAEVVINTYRRDISRRGGLEAGLEGASAVAHLAGQTGVAPSLGDPIRDMEANIVGSLNLLELCRRMEIPRFIFSSSSAPLGDAKPPVSEDAPPRPLSPYGASKLAVEGYCSAYRGSFGMKTIALRFSNVYGPRSWNRGAVIASFIRNILAGKPLIVYGTGNQTRDFLFVDDICSAITAAFTTENEENFGNPLHIATGVETSVNELIQRIEKLARGSGFGPVAVRYEPARAGEIERCCVNIGKARKTLGYAPAWDLDAGLEKTWKWYLRRKGL